MSDGCDVSHFQEKKQQNSESIIKSKENIGWVFPMMAAKLSIKYQPDIRC